ncbi:hypothetical protein SCANM124S_03921 [Streptomyces canus]
MPGPFGVRLAAAGALDVRLGPVGGPCACGSVLWGLGCAVCSCREGLRCAACSGGGSSVGGSLRREGPWGAACSWGGPCACGSVLWGLGRAVCSCRGPSTNGLLGGGSSVGGSLRREGPWGAACSVGWSLRVRFGPVGPWMCGLLLPGGPSGHGLLRGRLFGARLAPGEVLRWAGGALVCGSVPPEPLQRTAVRRPSSHSRYGPPTSEVSAPTGISSGGSSVLAVRSAASGTTAPASAEHSSGSWGRSGQPPGQLRRGQRDEPDRPRGTGRGRAPKVPSASWSEPIPSARALGVAEGPSEAPCTGLWSPAAFSVAPFVSAEDDEQPASSPPATDAATTAFTAARRATPGRHRD